MADIKTRDAVKGTIKTLDKAAVAGERMKSAYAKTKYKAEHGVYSDENSQTDYAIDKVSHSAEGITEKGVRQLDKMGRKNVRNTKKNVVKAKDKMAELKAKRAMKAAEKRTAQAASRQTGSQAARSAARHTSAATIQAAKIAPRTEKTIKQSAKGAKKTIKTTGKSTVKAAKTGVKTASTTAKTTIKTTEQTAKAAQATAKATAKATQRAAQAAKVTAKATAHAVKVAVKATISAVKAIIAGTKALISAIIAGSWIAVLIILIVVLFGALFSLLGGSGSDSSYTPVSAEVEAYEPLIQKYAKEHGISEYVELIKAVMMQESGGKGNDPMQASECGFNTRYPNTPNGITDPEYSINVGIQNLSSCLTAAEVESPIDMSSINVNSS